MTKGDLERLALANMITGLKEVKIGLGNSTYNGFTYYDVESEEQVIAFDVDVSTHDAESIKRASKESLPHIKFRRLERD